MMWLRRDLFFLTIAVTILGFSKGTPRDAKSTRLAEGEKKISELILKVLEHYKQPDPVGVPGAEVPDPYPVPDMKQSIAFGTTLYLKNTAVHGISKFRIIYINAEMSDMEVNAALVIDKLQAKGNYTMSSWVNKAQGPFTVDVTGLKIYPRANLGVERDGKLRAQDINMDLTFSTMATNFENLDFFGSMFQGVVNSVGNLLFDSIKPYILKEAYKKARDGINEKLEEVAGDIQFPNSISPLDMLITDARKKVRDMGMDPYKINDYNASVSVFSVALTESWVTGISSFHRVGNLTLRMENNTAIADFEIGTQKLEGTTHWEITAINGLITRAGRASFSVEYISGRIIIAQPLDTRKKPEFRSLDLDIGNIQVRFDGAGTLDYVIEFAINILPNLLRYQLMDALESPIREKLQRELDQINVEETIKQELPKIDQMQEEGFKLSDIKGSSEEQGNFDDDEFFNF